MSSEELSSLSQNLLQLKLRSSMYEKIALVELKLLFYKDVNQMQEATQKLLFWLNADLLCLA